ncbi:MAG: Ig-like domain-containing protein, partial [bacterium]|nr:Ig-like domain-containing protein [bacterium]
MIEKIKWIFFMCFGIYQTVSLANAIDCQITAPTTGQTVKRLVPIHITATDPEGVKSVWIKVEGETTSRAIEPNATTYGYLRAYSHISAGDFQWDWDTQKYPNGVYLLTACAYDSTTEYRYHSVASITVRNTFSAESGFRNYVIQVWDNFVKLWDPYNNHYGSNKYAALVGKYTAFSALYYAYTTSSSARTKTVRGITYAKDSLLAYYTFSKNGTTYHACYAADTSYGSVTVDGDKSNECYHTFWVSLAFAYARESLGTDTTIATTTAIIGLANHIEHIYCDVLGNLKTGGYSANGMGNAVAALGETALALHTTKYDNSIRYIYDALIWFQDWDNTGQAKGAFVDGGGYISEYPPLPSGTTFRC